MTLKLKRPQPIVVREFTERLGDGGAEVVDQDVGARDACGEHRGARCRRQVGSDAVDVCSRHRGANVFHGVLDARYGATGDDDARTGGGQSTSDGETDSGSGSADDRELSLQIDFHESFLVQLNGLGLPGMLRQIRTCASLERLPQ
jgi:hypothetical protein